MVQDFAMLVRVLAHFEIFGDRSAAATYTFKRPSPVEGDAACLLCIWIGFTDERVTSCSAPCSSVTRSPSVTFSIPTLSDNMSGHATNKPLRDLRRTYDGVRL
jgi:hypothetical protein